MRKLILWSVLFGALHGVSYSASANTTPNFTRGTMTSNTTSTTTVSEAYLITEYSTGTSYTMSGTNITWQGTPGPGVNYSQVTPGMSTQFSESYLGPGVASITELTRTTVTDSITNSVSVFTQ